MKNVYLAVLLLITNVAFSQVLYQESFETNANGTNYNTSIPEFISGTGNDDFFTRTDGSTIATSYQVTNMDGSFYFAGMDVDGGGATLPVSLSTTTIGVSGLASVDFSILLAEDDDGTNQDWDDNDYFHITYSVDGGTPQNLLWVENDGSQYNTAPLIDTDFDGIGDGAEITSVFTQYTNNITLTGASTIQFFLETNLGAGDEDIAFDNIVVSTTPTGPFISANPTTLSGFSQFIGTPSAEQSFDAAGANLTGDITATVTSGDYEISLTAGGPYTNTVSLAQTGGVVNTTPIYVRLNGTVAASPANGLITLSSASATDVTVTLEGDIYAATPTVFVSSNALSGFSHIVGTPSAEQSFDVSGNYLTGDITVTAPANYEVSETPGTGFGTTVTLTPTSGQVTSTPIYVRLNGTSANYNQTGDIVVSSPSATNETVTLTGETFDYTLYPIGAVTTVDGNGVADSNGVYVEVRGIVHCFDFRDGNGYSVTVIDSQEDGINLFSFSQVDNYDAVEGDSIGIKGVISQFNGLTQIQPDSIEVFSQANATFSPIVATALSETLESQYVTLEGLSLVNAETAWPATSGNVDVTDGTNTFQVRITASSPYAGQPTPNGEFDITGIVGQFDSSSPYDSGYQLFPCSINELCAVDNTTSVSGITISANATGVSYQWVDCDDNYADVPFQTNQDFTPVQNGNYAVIITESATCKDTSDCVAITTVGLSSENLNEAIQLYPNPVQDEMNISAKEVESIEIFSAAGKVIFSNNSFEEGDVKINTSEWESGVYFVNIKTQRSTSTFKVIK